MYLFEQMGASGDGVRLFRSTRRVAPGKEGTGGRLPSAVSSCSRLADLMRSSITCLASMRDSLPPSSIFLRLGSAPATPATPVETTPIEPIDDDEWCVALLMTAAVVTAPPAGVTPDDADDAISLGRSIEPVSLNPADPLLGFLSNHVKKKKHVNKNQQTFHPTRRAQLASG